MTGVPVDLGCEHAGEVVQLVLADGPYGSEVSAFPPVTFPVGKFEFDEEHRSGNVYPYNVLPQRPGRAAGLDGDLAAQTAGDGVTPRRILPYLSGPAAAVVILVWVVWMQRQDLKEMRRALDAANARATVADEAARTTLAALNTLAGRGQGPG